MKIDKELYEKYADKLSTAMRIEKLMNKEVAEIFDVPASYMSNLPKHPKKLSQPFVEKIRTWSISGKPLREYKLPETPETEAAAINQQEADTIPTAELTTKSRKYLSKLAVRQLVKEHAAETAAAIAEGIDTETDAKRQIVAALREEYERQNSQQMPEPTPDSETKIVAHKNGKVDVSRLDARTGLIIGSVEMEFDEAGDFTIKYRFRK